MNTKWLLVGALIVSLGVLVVLPNVGKTAPTAQTSVLMYDGGGSDKAPSRVKVAANFLKVSKKTAKAEDKVFRIDKEDRCGYDFAEEGFEPDYSAELVTVRKKYRHKLGEEFRVKVYVKNTGNMPWFSPDSKCKGVKVWLKTARDEDRESRYYGGDIDKKDNGWVDESTIRLDTKHLRIDPGEIASFTFWSEAEEEASVYREYFMPYLDLAELWLEDAEFKLDIYSGDNGEDASSLRSKLLYVYESMKVDDMILTGERSVEVDISDQKLYLKVGEHVVREFIISGGKASTPTPLGTYKITEKNEVRIGHSAPHYIMPRFQRFTPQGAGLHALPSLATDGGVFWTEALEHLGQPASHGCVRMAPEDADFAFEFTELGDEINIHW
ncbi:L,D-transpeptidase [Candidatus Peregrinibacteria bacterium]|jgi:hypothetical protein|nr:L,D-transpeptidase [Candidatus Peregrinibacteria bacterium]